MIQSAAINNFRGFKQVDLSGLRPINIIVGRNASGKTAFLEAMFLTLGASPEIAFRLRRWRGLGERIQLAWDQSSYHALWQDLFHDLNEDDPISITLKGSPACTRTLKVYYGGTDELQLPLGQPPVISATIPPVTFEWTLHSGETVHVKPQLTHEGLKIAPVVPPAPANLFASFLIPQAEEAAKRFSDLSKINLHVEFVELLQKEFPLVEGLSIEVDAGAQIYAQMSGMKKKLPIGIVSGGINKLMSIMLAIANSPDGITLIDEIENGFYFDRLLPIWSLLLRYSQTYNNQIFATTHSAECLKALLPIIQTNEDYFSLIRLERKDGNSFPRIFEGKDFRRAIESDIALR